MNARHLMLMVVAAVSALAMSSCKEELSYQITSDEDYTRNFIKTFGLIDPAQDWNLAKAGTVTVNVPGHANSVKVYAKVGEKYYLVADLVDIEGSIIIPVDIPETTNDLMVKIDGKKYYTANGGTVNAASRSIPDGISYVSVDYDSYIEFDMHIIQEITGRDGVLPEEVDNDAKDNVVKNFTMKYDGKPLTFYPVYFNSSSNHILGVCWIVDESDAIETVGGETRIKDGYAKILISHEIERDDSWNVISDVKTYRYVRKLPVYYDKIGSEMQYADTDPHASEGDGGEYHYYQYDQDQYLWDNAGDILNYIHADLDKIWNESGAVVDENEFAVLKNDIIEYYQDHPQTFYCSDCNAKPDNFEVYDVYSAGKRLVKLKLRHSRSQGGNDTSGPWKDYVTNPANNIQNADKDYMRAAPVSIDLSDYLNEGDRYLFYIDVFTSSGVLFDADKYQHTLYSYAPLNYLSDENATPQYPVMGAYPTAYAVYYKKVFSDDVERTFFSFEDWAVQKRDLNDLIFMVKTMSDGVDDDEDPYIPPVIDEDNPDLDPDPFDREYDETLSWLVAAEDLGTTDDFDFNDVIFSITSVATNKVTVTTTDGVASESDPVIIRKEIKVKALAAGGTLPVYLHFVTSGGTDYVVAPNAGGDGVPLITAASATTDHEWHKAWFGREVRAMLNTGLGNASGVQVILPSDMTSEFSVESYSSSHENTGLRGFYISVNEPNPGNNVEDVGGTTNGYALFGREPGIAVAPQMFLIPDLGHADVGGKWCWPKERRHILLAYPNFKEWVGNSTDAAEWYMEIPKPGEYYAGR